MSKISTNNNVFVGIDVSKLSLDVCILPSKKHLKVPNTPEGFKKIFKAIKQQPEMIVIEPTGSYHKALLKFLANKFDNVGVVNPYRAKNFIRAMGLSSKTDKIDAYALAKYASKVEIRAVELISQEQELLDELTTRRRQLVKLRTEEKNRLEAAGKTATRSINKMLKYIQKQIDAIELEIETLIESNDEMKEKKAILESVKGVAQKTSAVLLAELPELGKLSSKQISALVGVVPYDNSSGKRDGKRIIWGGRSNVRTALYMATLSGVQSNKPLREFYKRLRDNGKAKKTALVACMHKLLRTLNAMIKQKKYWMENQANPDMTVLN